MSAPQRSAPSPILVTAVAVTFACGMDAVIKHVAQSHSALLIAFARFGFATLATGVLYGVTRPARLSLKALRVHLLRGVVIAITATSFFYALGVLPLAEAVTYGFAAPLLVPFVAALLLKERIQPLSFSAAVVGFLGVFIAAYEPSGEAFTTQRALGIAAVLLSAAGYALSVVLLRMSAAKDGTIVTGFMGNLVPALILAAPAIATSSMPALAELPLFAFIGFMGAAFWLCLTWAYARAPAQVLAPLEYTALIWGSFYGYVFFQEVPRVQLYAGAAFIIGACLLVSWDESRRAKLISSSQA